MSVSISIFSCSKNDENLNDDTIIDAITGIIAPVLEEKVLLNINYGADPQQVYDIYLPAGRNKLKTKTLILVHGGAWIEGDKSDMFYIVNLIKENLPDYAIVNVNYRLATNGNYAFPMQINDIDAVVKKLKQENYDISNNFGFIGVSAGAQLSMLYSYTNNITRNIKMVASIVGPTNFNDPNYTDSQEWLDFYYTITGVNYEDNPEFYRQLSPLHKVNYLSVPTILLYGDQDPLIPISQGQDLHEKLDQYGIYNEYYLYEGGHGAWSEENTTAAYSNLIYFIQKKF